MITLTTLVGALALAGATTTNSDDAVSIDDSASVNTNINLVLPVDVTVTPFGRLQLDGLWGSGEPPFDTNDQAGFRRARVGVKGTAGVFDFKAEYDFAGGDVDFADAYIGWKESPLGRLTVGHTKEPVGLEALTSSRFTTFTERSLASNFAPFRNFGLAFSDSNDSLAWQYGIFGTDTDSSGSAWLQGQYAITGRLSGLAVNDEENLVHWGVSASNRSADVARYSARPEVPFVNRPVDTGNLSNDGMFLYGAEAAWVHGPLSVQAEYLGSKVDDAGGVEDATYSGWYGEVSYYITGEMRNYNHNVGVFGRPPVIEDFDGQGGMGAIQFAARYSMIDLNDGPTDEELADITLGVNWWLNNHTLLAANYVNASFDNSSIGEDADYLVVRFQLDF